MSSSSNSSSAEIKGKRKLWNVQTDFVTTPIFQNTLPSAPSGPFFKKIPLDNFSKYSNFDVSSLEKSYIWQPHFPDAGIKLDLVDQESILIPTKIPPLDPMDAKYMQITSTNATTVKKHMARRSALVTDVGEKPWWLRNTVYIENNLYNQPIIKSKEVAPVINTNLETPFNVTAIEESFEKIKNMDNYVHNARKVKLGIKTSNIQVEWSIPIFPDITTLISTNGNNNKMSQSLHERPSIPVRFDEDVETMVKNKKIKKNGIDDDENTIDNGDETSATNTNPSEEELNIFYSIISNLRQRDNKEAMIVNDKSLNISLIAPSTTTTRDFKQQHISSSSLSEEDENSSFYHWVSDFKMDITTSATQGDEFLMKLTSNTHNSHIHNSSSNSNSNGASGSSNNNISVSNAEYWPVKTRIEVHKLPAEEFVPHDAIVHRIPTGTRTGAVVGASSSAGLKLSTGNGTGINGVNHYKP